MCHLNYLLQHASYTTQLCFIPPNIFDGRTERSLHVNLFHILDQAKESLGLANHFTSSNLIEKGFELYHHKENQSVQALLQHIPGYVAQESSSQLDIYNKKINSNMDLVLY